MTDGKRKAEWSGWAGVLLTSVIALVAITVQWGVVTTKLDGLEKRLDEMIFETRSLPHRVSEHRTPPGDAGRHAPSARSPWRKGQPMSSSLPIDIADALVTALNAAPVPPATGFSPAFTAVRAYRPQFDLEELKTLRVSVVPKAIEITSLGRRSNQHDVSVDVAVQQKVDLTDSATLDALMLLVQQIADFLRLRRIDLGDGSSAVWVKTENTPIYSPDQLETKQVFTSVLTFTFRVVR